MRFIHTADIHLDSSMRSHFDAATARERRHEILNTFINMISYAVNNEIAYILICGDLFDTGTVSDLTYNTVLNVIKSNPDINFFYLKGNHDSNVFHESDIPDNLFLFDDSWKCYECFNGVNIWGIELDAHNLPLQSSFRPDEEMINIVMLHGQEAVYKSADAGEIININDYKYKGINYLAMGHVHEHKLSRLDGDNSYYCYPGCLEGRGYDETGVHGFMDVSIDDVSGAVTPLFVPFASRTIFDVTTDITGLYTSMDIISAVSRELEKLNISGNDIMRITLCGSSSIDAEVDEIFIRKALENSYYHVDVRNETKLRINPEDYMYDRSLTGEFIRLVLASDNDRETQDRIIRLGVNAIKGGTVL